MKTDWKLWAAIIILIGLVVALIVISVDKNNQVDKALREIEQLKQTSSVSPKVVQGVNGRTPVLGVDYTVQNGSSGTPGSPGLPGANGLNGSSGQNGQNGTPGLSAYDLAIEGGFQGTQSEWLASLSVKGDKGDAGPVLQTSCIDNHLSQKLSSDSLWQPVMVGTKYVKCELTDE